MSKKKEKGKKPRKLPKLNEQIPNSLIRRSVLAGPGFALEHARDYPIYGCWIMAGWKEAGLAPVVVAREQESGRILFGVYMVDLFCLGIKNVFTRIDYSPNRFERELPTFCMMEPEPCSVELAHEVIYGGLEYAESLGFQPHPDFKRMMANVILDPPDVHPRVDHVVFGKDGRPFYVSGPNDDEQKIASVLQTLTRSCDAGNFTFLAGMDELPD